MFKSLGDIFLGVVPSTVRAYMAEAFAAARDNHSRIVIPCAGRFTLVESAAAAKWDMAKLETSDVSLFSSVLGFVFSGRDVAELQVVLSGDLACFQSLIDGPRAAGAILAALKIAQLRQEVYYERIFRDDILVRFGEYAAQLDGQILEMRERLGGISYGMRDVMEVVEETVSDSKAILFINAPTYRGSYTKLFDVKGLIAWNEPKIAEFNGAALRPRLLEMCMGAKCLAFVFRGRRIEGEPAERAVFAAKGRGRIDYILCNRPGEAPFRVVNRRPTMVSDPYLERLPDDYEIGLDSKIAFAEVTKNAALYYRDLFAHKLGVTRAEHYFVAALDGFVMAVFGMFFSDVARGLSGEVHEGFGFTVPNRRYPRLNRLFMTAIVCKDARDCFQAHAGGCLREVTHFKTTCISVTPEQKTHRGSLKLLSREIMPDGRYKLRYGGAFKPLGFGQVIANWLDRMRNVEEETGRPMGVTRVALGAAEPD
jgi:hypothetical protein